MTSWLTSIAQSLDTSFTLRGQFKSFEEKDFQEYKSAQSQQLMDNFLDFALAGIVVAFLGRTMLLEIKNPILDLVLPFAIFSFIAVLYMINKKTGLVKTYFHAVAIPLIGILSARKAISQHSDRFFLNESFASWMIMLFYGSFASPMQWHSVTLLNCLTFVIYISIIFWSFGLQGVGNDFYVHIPTTIMFSSCLIRMNEQNLRKSFHLLSVSQANEYKWKQVLNKLTDGVLIMDGISNDDSMILLNASLRKMLGIGSIEPMLQPQTDDDKSSLSS